MKYFEKGLMEILYRMLLIRYIRDTEFDTVYPFVLSHEGSDYSGIRNGIRGELEMGIEK